MCSNTLCICPRIFITEVLHFVTTSGVPSVASTALRKCSWQVFMTYCVTKDTPIHFIDGKCHKATEKWKMPLNLFNQSHMVLYHNQIMPLVINVLEEHTQIHTNV